MSGENVATWLRLQAKEVGEDGSAASTIVLEGSDGTTWGTWTGFGPSKVEAVTEAVQGALRLFSEELPTGKHKIRLVALDGAEQHQFAVLPLTVTGRSSQAAAASTEALGFQRATTLAVQNFEAMTSGLRHENERLRERNDELMDSSHTLVTKLLEVETSMAALLRDDRREAQRDARMAELWSDIKPMVEVMIGFAGDALATQYEIAKQRRLAAAKGAMVPATPPPNPNPPEKHDPPPERENASGGAATGGAAADGPRGEPAVSPDRGGAPEPPAPPPDGPASGAGAPRRSVRQRSRSDPQPRAPRQVKDPTGSGRCKQPRSSTAKGTRPK